ncbi:hypothetical protein KIN20_021790 [Parelaphostrongylus tenuis]|uniref:Uncharacterized protein n=1 Tax=Parelaphostrongylus tenuis TaxID=148309 RepID=A0AAD5QRT1_PARTN|nr:hypothetical protein KIN20_021790 [Parelaphostrongylus tenuis]
MQNKYFKQEIGSISTRFEKFYARIMQFLRRTLLQIDDFDKLNNRSRFFFKDAE